MKKTLGQRIRELRQEKFLSLRDLGDLLKEPGSPNPVSAAFLSDLENGRRFPSDEMIGKIAVVLGTNEEELRKHDQRAPSRELSELVEMNAQYAFAFRRVLEEVRSTGMTPAEIVERVTNNENTTKHVDSKPRTIP